jgi:hypothetical protein
MGWIGQKVAWQVVVTTVHIAIGGKYALVFFLLFHTQILWHCYFLECLFHDINEPSIDITSSINFSCVNEFVNGGLNHADVVYSLLFMDVAFFMVVSNL